MLSVTREVLLGKERVRLWNFLQKRIKNNFQKPPAVNLIEWADKFRFIPAGKSADPGKWHTRNQPAAFGIMAAVCDRETHTVTGMTATQFVKSETLINVISYFTCCDPCSILVVQPTQDAAHEFSRRFQATVAVTPALRALIEHKKYKNSDNTLNHIAVPNGAIYFVGANTGDLSSRAVRIVLLDELDKYPLSAGVEGSPLKLAEERASTFKSVGRAKFVRMCSPTVEGSSLIGHEYAASDQRQCFVACPHCGVRQVLKWDFVRWEKDEQGGHLPKTAAITCCECGTVWSEADRIAALDELEHAPAYGWRQTKNFSCCGIDQTPEKWDDAGRSICSECGRRSYYDGHAGFHLSKLYSKRHRLSDIVQEFVDAEGSPEAKRKWRNTALAELWKPEYDESFSSSKLMARCEPYGPYDLNPSIKVILAGADTHPDRIEVQIIAFADAEEMFVITYIVLHGDPGQLQIWQELDAVRAMEFRVRGREGVMRITALAVDAGGTHTQDVLRYANERRGYVFACRGIAGDHPHIWPGKYNESKVTGRRDRYYQVAVDMAKREIYGRLAYEAPEPGVPKAGFIHFPIAPEIGGEYFAQLNAERPVRHKRLGGYKVIWDKIRERNEALDTMVLALALRQAIRRNIKHPPMYAARLKEDVSLLVPAPEPELMNSVAPESTERPTMTPQEYYQQQAERQLANEEKVAAMHRASWLRPHG
jgi:phage terminase large subunit GpA-like protein